MNTRYASRKFLLALLVELSATGLLIAGHIGETTWRDVTFAVIAAYLTANVAQKRLAPEPKGDAS